MGQYYFYDLETSGLDSRWHRIMQFAGQRTDEDFNPVGEPDNWLVKITNEILPEPEAVLITGVTPQMTLADGYTEAEFLQLLHEKAFTRNTTVLGFNSIRFDDEFIRNTLFRNYYDPYMREYTDGNSRWDIIDLVRMTRALRPDGIEWPTTPEGKPTNRLEELSKANKLEHTKAHDALSDVIATIDMAKLIKKAQPKLYEHLRKMSDKSEAQKFLESNFGKPIVHTTSKFSSDNLATSVVVLLGPHPKIKNQVLVYDLRHSPKQFKEMDIEQLQRLAFTPYRQLEEGENRLPVKTIAFNKSPAIAPIGVLDDDSQKRINLTLDQVKTHLAELQQMGDFTDKVSAVWEGDDKQAPEEVEAQLYGSFIPDSDKKKMLQMRNLKENDLADYDPNFSDDRLAAMLVRYKARNFPKSLSKDDEIVWEQYRSARLNDSKEAPINMTKYINRLAKLSEERTDKQSQFLLEELKLYAESIAPFENEQIV